MHVCPLHWECWKDWWRWGMPLRVYWGDRERFVTLWPFTGRFIIWWRFAETYEDSEGEDGAAGHP